MFKSLTRVKILESNTVPESTPFGVPDIIV